MTTYTPNWTHGPIGPGWLIMIPPVLTAGERAGGGAGSSFVFGITPPTKPKKKPKRKTTPAGRHRDAELLAILLLTE